VTTRTVVTRPSTWSEESTDPEIQEPTGTRVGSETDRVVVVLDLIPFAMDSATTLRLARQRSGLSLRQLAARADTSHSALAAYEAGRVRPSFDKMRHIVAGAGFDLEVTLVPRSGRDAVDRGWQLE